MPAVPRYPFPTPLLRDRWWAREGSRGSIALPPRSTIPAMNDPRQALRDVLQTLNNVPGAAGRPSVRLLAVSKTQPPEAVAALAAGGQTAFGENYVQEGLGKIRALAPLGLEWHLIGHLQ